jgi:carboxyl-terminal processing protease
VTAWTSTSYGLGLQTSAAYGQPDAHSPLFVTWLQAGGVAEQAGVRPGDVILSVDGVPPFAAGRLNAGVMDGLDQTWPRHDRLRLALHRPATGRSWTPELAPALRPLPTFLAVKLADGDVADVQLRSFGVPGIANQALDAIASLHAHHPLRGVVIDVRGNGGGAPQEVARLLGAFVHGRVWSYDCDARGACTANRTDDSAPLLALPLVVLADRGCACLPCTSWA